MMYFLPALILTLIIVFLTTIVVIKSKHKLVFGAIGFFVLILTLIIYFLIASLIFGINSAKNTNGENILVGIFRHVNWGLTRDEEIEEIAVSNNILEIKLVKMYAFEGQKNSQSTKECKLTLRYKNISNESIAISTSSKANFVYQDEEDDPTKEFEITANNPSEFNNLFVFLDNNSDQSSNNEPVILDPQKSIEKESRITCPKGLLNDFTYYYNPKNMSNLTAMNEIQILFNFTQGSPTDYNLPQNRKRIEKQLK